MNDFVGRVAVVTGAASGIGRAIAERCAAEGMRVVLADLEREPLEAAAEGVRGRGAEVLPVLTDVSDAEQVEGLARRTVDRFGGVDLLCNNAGVTTTGLLWEHSLDDWKWILGVNLWGVIHGIRSFVPRMLGRGDVGHVVNTASMAGLVGGALCTGVYAASKSAVVSVSETLALDLAAVKGRIGVSVLCPAWVKTRISDSARNRRGDTALRAHRADVAAVETWKRGAVEAGSRPEEIATSVFNAVRTGRFYVLPHPEWLPALVQRAQNIGEGANPVMGVPPPDLAQERARIRGS